MKEPKSGEEISAFHSRHQIWMMLGEPKKALDDLNKSIQIDPRPMAYLSRGEVYRHIGEYRKAVEDFARGEAMDPQRWQENAVPLLFQADAYARLGDEPNALAYCARLPDHFWTPGVFGTPPGNKAKIAEELKRRAAAARLGSI
jgi:tetratricopeptide (TPR) repeat protein